MNFETIIFFYVMCKKLLCMFPNRKVFQTKMFHLQKILKGEQMLMCFWCFNGIFDKFSMRLIICFERQIRQHFTKCYRGRQLFDVNGVFSDFSQTEYRIEGGHSSPLYLPRKELKFQCVCKSFKQHLNVHLTIMVYK